MKPLSATGRYQLVTWGDKDDSGIDAAAAKLENAVRLAFSHLNVNDSKFLVHIGRGGEDREFDPKMPAVGVFFGKNGNPVLSHAASQQLSALVTHGALVIPVVTDLSKFTDFVPSAIAQFNGLSIADCGGQFERLAARILEGFGLLRERRRLFISYRRVETSGVAAQCYEALDEAGFDVFLDTQGTVRPGTPFQEVLWHRLADTDVVLMLDSPGFSESRWTEEELARTNQSNIQILQVLWPERNEGEAAAFSTFHPLTVEEFENKTTLGPAARLKPQVVGEIVDLIEGLRARALASRHAALVREFLIEARSAGHKVHQTLDRNLLLSSSAGFTLIQPAIGIPDSEQYEQLMERDRAERNDGRKLIAPAIVLYDQKGIRDRWVRHLEWLNGNIAAVRSMKIVDARVWLTKKPK